MQCLFIYFFFFLVSLAVCKAGAVHKGLPLYKHIAELAGTKKVCKNTATILTILIILCGFACARLQYDQWRIARWEQIGDAGVYGATNRSENFQRGDANWVRNLPSPEESPECLALNIPKTVVSQVINGRYGLDATSVGDEGGFAPNIQNNREGLDLLKEAFAKSGHQDKVCDPFSIFDCVFL